MAIVTKNSELYFIHTYVADIAALNDLDKTGMQEGLVIGVLSGRDGAPTIAMLKNNEWEIVNGVPTVSTVTLPAGSNWTGSGLVRFMPNNLMKVTGTFTSSINDNAEPFTSFPDGSRPWGVGDYPVYLTPASGTPGYVPSGMTIEGVGGQNVFGLNDNVQAGDVIYVDLLLVYNPEANS